MPSTPHPLAVDPRVGVTEALCALQVGCAVLMRAISTDALQPNMVAEFAQMTARTASAVQRLDLTSIVPGETPTQR